MNTIRQEITIPDSGITEIRLPELKPGLCAEVFIIFKDSLQSCQHSKRISGCTARSIASRLKVFHKAMDNVMP